MATKKNPTPIDLLEVELGVAGPEPIELGIGEHSLHVRRSHTGLQVAQWQKLERERHEARTEALEGEGTDAEKLARLDKVGDEYLRALLRSITAEPTTEEEVDAVADFLLSLSGQAMTKVVTAIGVHSGLFDEEGKHIPFTKPLQTQGSTGD